MPKKIAIITLAIIAIIAVAGAATYIAQQRQDKGVEKVRQEEVATLPEVTEKPAVQPEEPTTTEPIDAPDWRVYRNEEYGFEFRYPSRYELENEERSVCLKSGEFKVPVGGGIEVVDCDIIIYFAFAGYLPLEKYILRDLVYLAEDAGYSIDQANKYARDIKRESIAGNNWIRFIDTLIGPFNYHNYVQKDNVVVNVSTEKAEIASSSEFYKLLESVKFFEPRSSGGVELVGSLSSEIRDKILATMFPTEVVKEGQIRYEYPRFIVLDRVIEGNFLPADRKTKLAIAILEGVSHAGLFSHFFLGLFDENYNLLSQPFKNPEKLTASMRQGHFANDYGQFSFYQCDNGQIFILFINERQPNAPWTHGQADLVKVVTGGYFEIVQRINPASEKGFGTIPLLPEFLADIDTIIVKPKSDRIQIFRGGFEKEVPSREIWLQGAGSLPTIYSHDLFWDKEHCKFIR